MQDECAVRGMSCHDSSVVSCGAFRIGGITVEILDTWYKGFAPVDPFERFRVEPQACDITIQVEWLQSLSTNPARPVFDSGCTWQLYEDRVGFQFDFCVPALGSRPYKRLLIDDCFSKATLQMNEESVSIQGYGLSPLTYPLDELLIMHRLTQEKAIELHGSGIVRADGIGNLFVGHSGAGKSTTTRLWTEREDVEVLSDDRIIVRRDEAAVETPRRAAGAACEHVVLHSAQDDKTRNAQDDRSSARDNKKHKMRMYGTPWHGEAMYASPNSAPLARVFVLEHGHGNVITRLSPSQAVAELFARSFVPFHRHEYVDSALEFLQELVDAVPVYRYAFEPDQRAVDKIIHFHD